MLNKIISPFDIICRELNRLDNDIDRLQMLTTLKSHLNNLQLNSNTLQFFFSIFNDERYRLQAINQLIPSIHKLITSDNLTILLELFTNHQNRLNLIEILKNYEPLKTNKEINEILLNEYRQYFPTKKIQLKQTETSKDPEPDVCLSTTSNVTKVVSNTSGVFEKAKQFVCRVFGGGGSSSSLNDELSNKRLINKVDSLTDNTEQKKFHTIEDDLQFQPTSISLSTSQSYTSINIKSPPPTPVTRQSSTSFHIDQSPLPIQSMMVTQIHSILDNIDSVLDKIEAQSNSINRRPAFNENYPNIETSNSFHLNIDVSEELVQQTTDQITQTAINIVEHHLNMNDGSGDTTPAFIDLLDIVEESSSIISSDESEELIDSFH